MHLPLPPGQVDIFCVCARRFGLLDYMGRLERGHKLQFTIHVIIQCVVTGELPHQDSLLLCVLGIESALMMLLLLLELMLSFRIVALLCDLKLTSPRRVAR